MIVESSSLPSTPLAAESARHHGLLVSAAARWHRSHNSKGGPSARYRCPMESPFLPLAWYRCSASTVKHTLSYASPPLSPYSASPRIHSATLNLHACHSRYDPSNGCEFRELAIELLLSPARPAWFSLSPRWNLLRPISLSSHP